MACVSEQKLTVKQLMGLSGKVTADFSAPLFRQIMSPWLSS
jgi:hypothetical protein